jgi:uncharacterized protein YacL
MSRTLPDTSGHSGPDVTSRSFALNAKNARSPRSWNAWLFRFFLIAAAAAVAVSLAPFGLHGWYAAVLGIALALMVLFVEIRLRNAPTASIVGGAIGGILGALAALLVTLVVSHTSEAEPVKSFFEYASLLGFGFVGVMLGARKAVSVSPGAFQRVFPSATSAAAFREAGKLLDTSVLIDGRIADICEAHFLDGPLIVPQFVLHELQMIADSADSLRRQRGRRGLEVLQRIQKMQSAEVRILDENSAVPGDVDHKLVELAQRLHAKIVTNDFNLNKVASVQGIGVLNINLLANAVRPAVLPGEGMRVFILREGKEVNQGVAYLEDGTMVVVDGARRLINKTVDILVTSVHQTPAGKMIFGRLDERSEALSPVRQAAAGARSERFNDPSGAS